MNFKPNEHIGLILFLLGLLAFFWSGFFIARLGKSYVVNCQQKDTQLICNIK